jgi:hypothetical protein
MTGTRTGARKAAQVMRERYGENYFHLLGLKGGNPVLLEQRRRNLERQK